jgi:hypothetical protein
MLESFLVKHGAAGTKASLFIHNTGTFPAGGKTPGNLFFAVNKSRAHPAKAELYPFFPVQMQHLFLLPALISRLIKR